MLIFYIFQAFALLVGCAWAQEPEFNLTFDATRRASEYKTFIGQLRNAARDPNSGSHNLPVLPPQPPSGQTPTRFFDVVLQRAPGQAIRVRLRRDNLFVIGYRNNNTDSPWYELIRTGEQGLINESTPLGFRGDYNSLQGAANQQRSNIQLGRQQFQNAVGELLTATTGQQRAHGLLIVIQMLSESARFTAITDEIVSNYEAGATPSQRAITLQTSWGALSGEVLHQDQTNQDRLRLPAGNTLSILNIHTLADIVLVLGILLRQHPTGSGSRARRAAGPARMDTIEARQNSGLILPGRPLVEIFHVYISNIDNENPGDLYGTITATDGLNSYYIYNRDRSNYESIYPGGNPTLTGPSRAISAADDFVIDFKLMDKDSDASPDDEIINEKINWSPFNWKNVFDTVQSTGLSGKYGNGGLVWAVLSNAAEALVEVILINGDNENPADVFGKIESQTTKFSNKITLFYKDDKNYIDVRPGQAIPLLRSTVVVPMDSTLKIIADLTDHDSDASPNDEIAKGTAEFKPEILKSTKQSIKGKYGEVEVRISWL